MIDTVLFWALAVTAVASALSVITMRNPANSVMALLLTMFATAGLYALMGAPILALFQVIIYIGAVMVLFVFVIMLLNLNGPVLPRLKKPTVLVTGAVGTFMTAGAAWLAWKASSSGLSINSSLRLRPEYSVAEIAMELFSRHLLVFELTSVLLFAAVVGAVFITRKEKEPS